MTIDIANFYLMTPMDKHEHLRMNIKTFPDGIMKERKLGKIEHNGCACVEIRKGACGLSKAGILASDLLKERI